ncbi:MAG: outer membrane beta-barrel protein [Chitinophagaceae bacterium]|nr:outer membrane beta-barrel protein [Chitinophagaceae bacterium]
MHRLLCFIFLSLLGSFSAVAQEKGISGKVKDTLNVKPVVFASVSAIRKSDSILVRHTRTNQQGSFMLKPLQPGQYILLVSHSSFVDYVDEIEVKETDGIKPIDDINLYQRGQLLKEVVIKNSASIKIKGDTLEYLADSFKVKEGAMVEDLLKVLPGIQVNKKGEITAMGEKVEKVLVDGEEFFGDDPTVATQNIQSKVVEKVQVFDKKSDQAQFTGFDDGQEQKTINLKLKDNMNRGEFGKVELGGGWEDRWQNQAMLNSFKNKRQLSIYGVMSSNGKTGLGWEDRNTYTGEGGGMSMDEDGGFMWTVTDDGDDDNSRGFSIPEGITKAWTGGVHFANKWKDGDHHLNANYSFGRINRIRKQNSNTENLFPGNTYQTQDTSNTYSSRNTHRLTAKYTWNIDSSTTLIYNLNSRLGFIESETENSTNNRTYEEVPISSSVRDNSSNSTQTRVNNNLVLNKKFKKVGRTISVSGTYNYNKNDAEGMLSGVNTYGFNGSTMTEILDQKKVQNQLINYINADLSYTEPLTKKILLKTSYAYTIDNSLSGKSTLVKPQAENDYTQQIDTLSSDFNSSIYSHTVGAEIKYNEKKYNFAIGSRVRYSLFHQDDLVRNLNYDYNRWNAFPTVRFNYKFSQFSRVTFNYNGSTRQPSITQMQPVQDNSNPLEIYVGNPSLKIGYNQNFNLNYFSYKVFTGRSIYTGISFSNSFNNIALNRTFDPLGRTINQYVNLNGGYNATMWGGIRTKIPKTDLEVKLDLNGNYGHTPNIINNQTGTTNSYFVTLSPGINYTKEDLIYLSAELKTIYNNAVSTIQSNRNIRYIGLNPNASATVYFLKNFEAGTDIDYQYNPPVAPYNTSFNRFIWNGYVSYKMLKGRNLTWRAGMNDILNQNRGYDRTTTNNFNTERFFMTLGRYWMVSAVWTFSSGPMAAQHQQGGGGMRPKGMRGGMRGGGRRMSH